MVFCSIRINAIEFSHALNLNGNENSIFSFSGAQACQKIIPRIDKSHLFDLLHVYIFTKPKQVAMKTSSDPPSLPRPQGQK